MPETKSIVIVSGPVGAGKSTVARELLELMPEATAFIEGDTFWSHMAKPNKKIGRRHNFKMVMMAMTAAAVPYALYGYETILDFSVPPWFLETAAQIANRREVPLDYVVLLPAIEVCAERSEARIAGRIPYDDGMREFYTTFAEAGARHIVSDDAAGPKTLAARIREGLDEGKFRLAPMIAG